MDYMAPEQIRGEPITGAADIYSPGCVAFECVAGQPPFANREGMQVLSGHLQDEPPDPSPDVVPPEFAAAIKTALFKQPEDRPRTSREFARLLSQAAGVPIADRTVHQRLEGFRVLYRVRLSPHQRVPAVLNFAFIGCHHDDIELGAGVLVQRVLAAGHGVEILVLTDDAAADARHRETIRAARELGIDPESVHFMGLPDGDLTANRETVGAVRALGLDPQVVVTHSAADSHNDHRAANQLAFAAFRETVILQYSIHISARLDFAPRFFVALNDESVSSVRKELALGAHGSQQERIMKRDRAQFEAQLGGIAGLPAAEAFELNVQVGGEAHLPELMALNGAPFHSLWYPLLGTEPVVLLYEAFLGQPHSIAEFSRHHESEGRDALRTAFAHHWYPQSPLSERHSSDREARACVNSGNVILAGSPVNNPITGGTFNKLPSIRWITEHDDARESVYLLDKETQRTYHPIRDEGGRLTHDLTVLSILPNPFADHGSLISCAGIHGVGTQALLEFLAAPTSNKDLLNTVLLRGESLNLPLTADANSLALSPFAYSPA